MPGRHSRKDVPAEVSVSLGHFHGVLSFLIAQALCIAAFSRNALASSSFRQPTVVGDGGAAARNVCLRLRLIQPTPRPNLEVKARDHRTVDQQLIVTLRKIFFNPRNMVVGVDWREPQGDNVLRLYFAIGLHSLPAQYAAMTGYLN
jgi:hypothetical protein